MSPGPAGEEGRLQPGVGRQRHLEDLGVDLGPAWLAVDRQLRPAEQIRVNERTLKAPALCCCSPG